MPGVLFPMTRMTHLPRQIGRRMHVALRAGWLACCRPRAKRVALLLAIGVVVAVLVSGKGLSGVCWHTVFGHKKVFALWAKLALSR